jgi:hypothetical protein
MIRRPFSRWALPHKGQQGVVVIWNVASPV